MRINICPACSAANSGMKTRIALPHTCGQKLALPVKRSYARFFALLKQVNANGLALTKEEAIKDFTNKRTISLSSLSDQELKGIEAHLSSLVTKKSLDIPQLDPVRDKMRKAIISQFKSIGRTAADAKAWAEKYGVGGQKKDFGDYTEQELFVLIRNAEKVKEDFKNALNRHRK